MKNKLVILLEELKNNYSDKILNETLETLKDINHNDFDEICKNEPSLFNNQDERFYDALAIQFVEDLNNYTLTYFYFWEYLMEVVFDEKTREYIYDLALKIDVNGDTTNYINGFIHLRNDNPEIALFYFNKIDFYVASYFIGWCYLLVGNYENSIKNNLFFLKKLKEVNKIKSTKDYVSFSGDVGILPIFWNVLNDLGYCYNRIQEYDNAIKYYQESLDIFNLSEVYEIYNPVENNNGFANEFIVFVNNYLFALEKNQNYSECIEVLNFVIEKMPEEYYYKNQLSQFKEKLKNHSFADEVLKQLLKPKRSVNIGSFEQTKLISKEKNLEDMILEQIKHGFKVFNKNLEIYQDENIFGRQYYISSVNGFLDLLLIDKKTDVVYVVELKRNKAGIEVVKQTEKYIYGIKHEIDNEVKGIICLHKPKPELIELVNQKENIELYTYNFEFTKIE